MQLMDYFDQIYIVNLAHRHDRRREMAAELQRIGLSFDSPNVRLFEAVRPEDVAGFPTIGTRGCFLSHLGVLRDARDKRFERILLFEDDLSFADDFSHRIAGVVGALKNSDWSIFYGGYSMEVTPRVDGVSAVLVAPACDPIQTAHFIGFQGSAIADAVTFLEAILRRPPGDPEGGPMHVDGAYAWFRCKFPARVTLLSATQLGYQRSSRTDIHELRWFDRLPGTRQALQLMRAVRNKAKRRDS